ncbi:hypothetical protein [Paenibacillus dendritiformis]|nr:hypothetical protein [Paenibacillus dendritiformis]
MDAALIYCTGFNRVLHVKKTGQDKKPAAAQSNRCGAHPVQKRASKADPG